MMPGANRWKAFTETVTTANFWWTVLGILSVLLLWFYLYYLAIKHLDTSLAMHSTFCASEQERNWRILVIVLMTPLFLVGLLGVISEWLTIMDNRRNGYRNSYKALIVFFALLQVTAVVILFALQC